MVNSSSKVLPTHAHHLQVPVRQVVQPDTKFGVSVRGMVLEPAYVSPTSVVGAPLRNLMTIHVDNQNIMQNKTGTMPGTSQKRIATTGNDASSIICVTTRMMWSVRSLMFDFDGYSSSRGPEIMGPTGSMILIRSLRRCNTNPRSSRTSRNGFRFTSAGTLMKGLFPNG